MSERIIWLADYLLPLAIPGFLILLVLEFWWLRGRQGVQGYGGRDTAASLTMGVGNVLIAALTGLITLGISFAVYDQRLLTIPMTAWWAWVVLIVTEDFCYYLFHRFSHRVRLGWAAHVNHHSSRYYNLSTALRQSWTTPFYGFAFYLPLAWLGFHPLAIVVAHSINLIYQFWIHTEAVGRLGPLEWILNTPSHHRVHHGINPRYIDRNYGGIFIIWDRLFGTFEPEREAPRYGLTTQLTTFNPLRIAFHEWAAIGRDLRAARSCGTVFRAMFSPPGAKLATGEQTPEPVDEGTA